MPFVFRCKPLAFRWCFLEIFELSQYKMELSIHLIFSESFTSITRSFSESVLVIIPLIIISF